MSVDVDKLNIAISNLEKSSNHMMELSELSEKITIVSNKVENIVIKLDGNVNEITDINLKLESSIEKGERSIEDYKKVIDDEVKGLNNNFVKTQKLIYNEILELKNNQINICKLINNIRENKNEINSDASNTIIKIIEDTKKNISMEQSFLYEEILKLKENQNIILNKVSKENKKYND